jgi:hypothetical protein
LDGQPTDFLKWLAKVMSLVAVACFLPSRAKDLSVPRHVISTLLISIIRRVDAGSLLPAVQSLLAINTGYIIYHTVDVKIPLLDQE